MTGGKLYNSSTALKAKDSEKELDPKSHDRSHQSSESLHMSNEKPGPQRRRNSNEGIPDPDVHEFDGVGEISYSDSQNGLPRSPSWVEGGYWRERLFRVQQGIIKSIPSWMRQYQLKWLRGDITAGVTVGVMSVPQGMAYALIAGLPPILGLYASTIPLLIYALLGTSRELALGPFAVVSLLSADAVSLVAELDTQEFIQWSIVLTFMMGLVLITMSFLRLGFIINFLSTPVLEGFQSASAFLIGISQIKYLFGNNPPRTSYFYDAVYEFFVHIKEVHLWTTIMGLSSVAMLLFLRNLNTRLSKRNIFIPAPLVALIIGLSLGWGLSLDHHGVKLVGTIPQGLPPFSVPKLNDWEKIKILLPQSVIIAVVTFMLSVSVAKKFAEQKKYEMNSNQELFALGSANLVGSFFSSFPISGSLSRTSVNATSGANSQIAGILSATIVFASLLVLTNILYYLPMNILAAIIMVAVIGLVDTNAVKDIWKTKRIDILWWCVAFFSTLMLGIANGIVVSVGLSLIGAVYSLSRPRIVILGRLPGSQTFRSIVRFPHALVIPGIKVIRLESSLFFANVAFFKDKLMTITLRQQVEFIVLDWSSVSTVDYTACRMLKNLVKDLSARDIVLLLASVKGPARDILKTSGLVEIIGTENIFWELHDAVAYAAKLIREKHQRIIEDSPIKQPTIETTEASDNEDDELELESITSQTHLVAGRERSRSFSKRIFETQEEEATS